MVKSDNRRTRLVACLGGMGVLLSLISISARVAPLGKAQTNTGGIIAKPAPASKKAPPSKKSAPSTRADQGILEHIVSPMPAGVVERSRESGIGAPADPSEIRVRVLMDESGKVTEAQLDSGHPFLIDDALSYARGQRYKPATRNGRAIKSVGWIYFVFTNNADVRSAGGIDRGLLKTVTLPMPPEAKEWEKRGDGLEPKDGQPFKVLVTIDEKGDVIATEVGDGHPALTRAAMSDAKQQHVAPATRNEQPVKSAGWIDYVFTDRPAKPPNPPLPLHSFDFVTVTLDSSGKLKSRETKSANAYTEDLGSGVKLEMVAIPPGEFMMGSSDADVQRAYQEMKRYNGKAELAWYTGETPQHRVRISHWFYLGEFEVTQAQWRAVMGTNPSKFKDCNDCPVEQISWNDATEFCRKLSARTGHEYRLPSEAEWEYAARAGTTTPFAFGDTITPEIVNYNGDYPYGNAVKGTNRQKTVPAGSLGVANAFGLYDMHGNVWEWCQDWYHDSYAALAGDAPTDGSAWLSGGEQKYRVVRGGEAGLYAVHARSAERSRYPPDFSYDMRGFRLVAVPRAQ